MARQTFYLARDVKNPLYKTRMLQAGPIELDASAARLYRKLGVELLDEAPRTARQAEAQAEHNRRQTEISKARTAEPEKAPAKRTLRRKREAAAKK